MERTYGACTSGEERAPGAALYPLSQANEWGRLRPGHLLPHPVDQDLLADLSHPRRSIEDLDKTVKPILTMDAFSGLPCP
ncbi:MAG: hypothetical protein OXC68_01790 [Aestuariivita sp.]|nr:hypothetical protein [Aestuariivita sp.]